MNERDSLRAENERLRAEVEMLRGVGCGEDGDGPCGVCLKCAKALHPQPIPMVDQHLLIAQWKKYRKAAKDDIGDPHDHVVMGRVISAETSLWKLFKNIMTKLVKE